MSEGGEHFGESGKALQVLLRLPEVFILSFCKDRKRKLISRFAGKMFEYSAIGLADHRFDLGLVGLDTVVGEHWNPGAAAEVLAVDEDAIAIEYQIVHR